jgi:hypothetical protein
MVEKTPLLKYCNALGHPARLLFIVDSNNVTIANYFTTSTFAIDILLENYEVVDYV